MFICTTNIACLSLYSGAQLQGNKFVVSTVHGCSAGLAVLINMALLPYINEIVIYLIALFLILSVSLTRFTSQNLSNQESYALHSLQIIGVGNLVNV
jgi:hypothetical protein